MKKIAIVGNSPISIGAIEEIRKTDQESEITLFCQEGVLPYNRDALGDFLGKEISQDDLRCKAQDFFDSNRINLILDKKIARIHPKRKRLVSENKEQFPYDTLFIEESFADKSEELKGSNKEGVFFMQTLQNIQEVSDAAPLTDVIIVQLTDISMLRIACALRKLDKEIVLVSSTDGLLLENINKDVSDFLIEHLKENGIRIVLNNEIVEILGDAQVKAIRLKTGKVLESQLVVLGGAKNETPLFPFENFDLQKTDFYTKTEDIFMIEDIKKIQIANSAQDLVLLEQGKIIGAAMIDVPRLYENPFSEICFKLFDLSVYFVGQTKSQKNITEYVCIDRSKKTYKKFLLSESCTCGAILLNCQEDQEKAVDFIKNKLGIAEVQANLFKVRQEDCIRQPDFCDDTLSQELKDVSVSDKPKEGLGAEPSQDSRDFINNSENNASIEGH